MLVLSRKPGEEVVIGNNIRLKVLAINGKHVRLGFTAPREVSIQREELGQKIRDAATLAVVQATLKAEP